MGATFNDWYYKLGRVTRILGGGGGGGGGSLQVLDEQHRIFTT